MLYCQPEIRITRQFVGAVRGVNSVDQHIHGWRKLLTMGQRSQHRPDRHTLRPKFAIEQNCQRTFSCCCIASGKKSIHGVNFSTAHFFQIISLAGVSGACGQSHPGCRGACGISSAETACPRPPFQLCGFSGSAIAWGNSFRQPSRNSRRSGGWCRKKMSSRSVGIKQ